MIRRTRSDSFSHKFRVRLSTDLQYKGEGKTHSGFKEPYTLWSWKQTEIYRSIQEHQFEHLRRVYKRQWFEAFRVNADEYVYKYNITKAATIAKWENEMQSQETAREEVVEKEQGRQALKDKHQDLLKEFHERQFFYWYERASERLQHLSRAPFVTRDGLDAHIEKELNKYVVGADAEPSGPFPLNFVGQMPMLETTDLAVASAPRHLAAAYRAETKNLNVGYFEAPIAETLKGTHVASEISADVHKLDDDSDSNIAATVFEQLAQEQSAINTKDDRQDLVSNLSDSEYQANRRKYLDRGNVGVNRRDWKMGGVAKNVENIIGSPTVAEGVEAMKEDRAKDGGRSKGRKDARKDKKARAIGEAVRVANEGGGGGTAAPGKPGKMTEDQLAEAAIKRASDAASGGQSRKIVMGGKIKKDHSGITDEMKDKLRDATKDGRTMFSKIRSKKPPPRT